MLAMGRKLTLGCAALMCAASLAACGGGGEAGGSEQTSDKPATTPKPQPPKPHGTVLRVDNDAESYTAQTVSSKLSYESPDGKPVDGESVYLEVLMVVRSGLKDRPTNAPGWEQIDVKKPEWGDNTPTLKPVTNYYTADQVDASGKGHGAGVKPVTGKLEANTPYYVTFGAEISKDRDVKGSQLCGYPDENPRCIPLGTVSPAKS